MASATVAVLLPALAARTTQPIGTVPAQAHHPGEIHLGDVAGGQRIRWGLRKVIDAFAPELDLESGSAGRIGAPQKDRKIRGIRLTHYTRFGSEISERRD